MGAFSRILAVLAVATLAITAIEARAQATAADPQVASALAADRAAQAAGKSASAASVSAAAAATAASSAEAAAHNAWVAPNAWVLYLVPVFVLMASVVSIRKIAGALLPTNWSLADALSEDTLMPAYTDAVPAANGIPAVPRTLMLDNDKKPVLVPEMHASSSRVIALMGMMAILFLFLGFGVFAIFEFGATGKVPESIESVVKFLMSGLTLFAPYLVNKFASIFKLTPSGK